MHREILIQCNDASEETRSTASSGTEPLTSGNGTAPPAEEAERCKETKEKVREYMERRGAERRQNSRAPLHDLEAIRKEIGWDMVERRQGDRRRG